MPLCAKPGPLALQWRHNDSDGVSNRLPQNCLLNRVIRHRTKKTSKYRVIGLNVGNSLVTNEFPAQRASNVEMFRFDDVIMEITKVFRSLLHQKAK